MWVPIAAVVLLHVLSAVRFALGISGSVLNYALLLGNALAHITLFAVALILGVKAEEVFLAVMISAAVGMLSVFFSEKAASKRAAEQIDGKENNDGI